MNQPGMDVEWSIQTQRPNVPQIPFALIREGTACFAGSSARQMPDDKQKTRICGPKCFAFW